MFKYRYAHFFWLAVLAIFVAAPAGAHAALVSHSSGVVTFTPADLVTPVITAIIAAVGAAVALWVIWTGLKWIFKILGIKR